MTVPAPLSRIDDRERATTPRRVVMLLLICLIVGMLRELSIAAAIEIGGAVYTFNLEGDGQYHLRGYACNRKGQPSDQVIHPSVEVYLDAPVIYGGDGAILPGSGTLIKAGFADQPGSTRDEAEACDYVHNDSPSESFWRNMRFDLPFSTGQLAPLVGRRLFVSGAWHASATRVQEAQLANSPITVLVLALPPLTVTCRGTPASPSPNDTVTWTAATAGGTGVYAFAWHDDDGHSAVTGSSAQWSPVVYLKSGVKTTDVTVFDNSIPPNVSSARCQLPVVLVVNSAVLPSSRSVMVNIPVTAFLAASVVSTTESATGCRIEADPIGVPSTFSFQQTDPATNAPVGDPDPLFDLAASPSSKSFVVSLTLSDVLPSTEVGFGVICSGGAGSTTKIGINTLKLSVSAEPVPDLIAVAATPSSDGIVTVAKGSPGAFSIAAVNAGITSGLAAFVSDTSGKLPFERLTICQTKTEEGQGQGQCLALPVPGGVLFTLGQAQIATFSVFVAPNEDIPFDPEHNRLLVEFKDFFGNSRGRTSVAITTTKP